MPMTAESDLDTDVTFPDEAPGDWQKVLDRDEEEAFRAIVRPYVDPLMRAAADDIEYYVAQGDLHKDDLAPEDVTGEALVYAWQHRAQRPSGMSLKGWLLGTQYRVLRDMVERRKQYRKDKAVSLDDPVPAEVRAQGQQERRQTASGLHDGAPTWEEVTTGSEPRDVEAPLFTNESTFELDPDSRHVVMMHDEFDVPLPEIASTMDRALSDAERMLSEARTTLRDVDAARGPNHDAPTAPPNPPEKEAGG